MAKFNYTEITTEQARELLGAEKADALYKSMTSDNGPAGHLHVGGFAKTGETVVLQRRTVKATPVWKIATLIQ